MHRRFKKIGRTVALIGDLLSGKRHDRQSAARRLGVKPPAADRQLRAVMSLPGVIATKDGRRRVLSFDPHALGGAPSVATAIAACFGASLGPLFRGTLYERAMQEAREHILRLARHDGGFRNIERKFVFRHQGGEVALPDEAGQLDALIKGMLEDRWATFRYEHFNGKLEAVRVQPLSLLVYEHQLYVLGRDPGGTLHPFRFARIRGVELEVTRFAYPSRAEYDPEQAFATSLGVFLPDGKPVEHVELRLTRSWLSYVQSHRWHTSQKISLDEEGITLSLDVTVCPEVVRWVLAFGDDAVVVRPNSLRQEITGRAARLAKLYEGH